MTRGNFPATITVEEAGELLGLSRSSAYRAAARGELPTLRFGRRLVVPTGRLLAMLGLDDLADEVRDERRSRRGEASRGLGAHPVDGHDLAGSWCVRCQDAPECESGLLVEPVLVAGETDSSGNATDHQQTRLSSLVMLDILVVD